MSVALMMLAFLSNNVSLVRRHHAKAYIASVPLEQVSAQAATHLTKSQFIAPMSASKVDKSYAIDQDTNFVLV